MWIYVSFLPQKLLCKILDFTTGDYENDDVLLCDIIQMVPVFQGILHCRS